MATEYERKRLENIRRNDEMMAALKVRSKASLLSDVTKPRRVETKSFKKRKEPETPIVVRQSLRTRGLDPDSGGLPDGFIDTPKYVNPRKQSPRVLAPLPFDDAAASDGSGSGTPLVDTLLGIARNSCLGKKVKGESDESSIPSEFSAKSSDLLSGVKTEFSSDNVKKETIDFVVKSEEVKLENGLDLGSMSLESHNVARVVPGRILVVKFLPSMNANLIAAGDKLGNVGFWNMDCTDQKEDDGLYLYRPHNSPVSSIVFQQNSSSKVITSSYDGLIRLMDVEKLVFDLVYSNDDAIFSLSQKPNDEQSLYFCEGYGMLKIWDLRAGKSVHQWSLHDHRINSIDFNPQKPHVMATSSTDGTACLWDLRNMRTKQPKTLKIIHHTRAVHSAYFSPSGLKLATTSIDNNIRILSSVNYEVSSMINHDNNTGRWISNFKGIWGWDDSYVFVGNLSKAIDVISLEQKRTVMTLQDPLMRAIPCRLDAHRFNVGMIAGGTGGGQVYVWTRK